jgi:hypothetical protein
VPWVPCWCVSRWRPRRRTPCRTGDADWRARWNKCAIDFMVFFGWNGLRADMRRTYISQKCMHKAKIATIFSTSSHHQQADRRIWWNSRRPAEWGTSSDPDSGQ